MKKIIISALLLLVVAFGVTGCQQIANEAGIVKKDVEGYIKSLEGGVGKVEGEVATKFEEIKEGLKEKVEDCEEFAVKAKDGLVGKVEELSKGVKGLDVNGPTAVKELHTKFADLIAKQETALKNLVKSIEGGVQADYEKAKDEFIKIVDKIKGHKEDIHKLAK